MTVVFKKNESKSFQDLGGCSPMLVMAIGWKNKESGILDALTGESGEADLDLSCAVYDKNDDRIDCVWYADLNSKDGAIRHKGDDTTGWHHGDSEIIMVDLNALDEETATLFFVISSFAKKGFEHVASAYWRIFDGQTKREIGRYDFDNEKADAKIVLRLKKTVKDGLSEWRLKALDENATGHNVQEVFSEIRHLIDGE